MNTDRIAVVQGAPSDVVQDTFRALVDRWRPSVRVAGVIAETHGLDLACSAGFLCRIGSGERISIFRDLEPGATGCHIDAVGVRAAAEAVQRDIAAGCDLVVLSKFGKLEAAGTGLLDAFKAALDAGIPVLTSVSSRFEAAWEEFAGPGITVLAAEPAAIDAWRRDVVRPLAMAGNPH